MGSVPLIALLHAATQPIATNDLHIYLAMGRWMREHSALLEHENFSFLAHNVRFINGTWGWSLLALWLHDLGGLRALGLANGLAVAAAVALTGLAARGAGARPAPAALASLYAWLLLLQNVSVRGQTLCYPLFAGLLALGLRPPRPLFALAAGVGLGALWAPLHGSWVAGALALGALLTGGLADRIGGAPVAKGPPWQRQAALLLGLLVGVGLGPYGPLVLTYVLQNTALPADRAFAEWASPSPDSFEGARFFAAVGLWLWLRGTEHGRGRAAETLLLLGFGALALGGVRFIAFFGLATAPLLALRLSEAPAAPGGVPRAALRATMLLLGVIWAGLLGAAWSRWEPRLTDDTPTAAIDAVRADAPAGRVFLQAEYGGYAVWALGHDYLISTDIRTWVYDDAGWGLATALEQGPADWQERLDELGVTHLVLRPGMHGEALLRLAEASPAWRQLPCDGDAVALARVDPPAALR